MLNKLHQQISYYQNHAQRPPHSIRWQGLARLEDTSQADTLTRRLRSSSSDSLARRCRPRHSIPNLLGFSGDAGQNSLQLGPRGDRDQQHPAGPCTQRGHMQQAQVLALHIRCNLGHRQRKFLPIIYSPWCVYFLHQALHAQHTFTQPPAYHHRLLPLKDRREICIAAWPLCEACIQIVIPVCLHF